MVNGYRPTVAKVVFVLNVNWVFTILENTKLYERHLLNCAEHQIKLNCAFIRISNRNEPPAHDRLPLWKNASASIQPVYWPCIKPALAAVGNPTRICCQERP